LRGSAPRPLYHSAPISASLYPLSPSPHRTAFPPSLATPPPVDAFPISASAPSLSTPGRPNSLRLPLPRGSRSLGTGFAGRLLGGVRRAPDPSRRATLGPPWESVGLWRSARNDLTYHETLVTYNPILQPSEKRRLTRSVRMQHPTPTFADHAPTRTGFVAGARACAFGLRRREAVSEMRRRLGVPLRGDSARGRHATRALRRCGAPMSHGREHLR
jgi:hypothetical protein